jgi:hypothetical protein
MTEEAHETPAIDQLFEDIEKLRRAAELLEKIWGLIGPYGRLEVEQGPRGDLARSVHGEPDRVWSEVRDHFGFDDSE